MSKNSRRKTAAVEVGIVMGSDSDWPFIESTVNTLHRFAVHCETRVISAHRTPELASEYAAAASRRGLKVMIAAAGGAAHLAGILAAHTTLPVIGIPVKCGSLDGLDSLLATVQMPAGVPVATVALGDAGPVNAGILAVQILALQRPELARRLQAHKKALKEKVNTGNQRIQSKVEKKS